METYRNEPESDFETDIESDFVTCNDYIIDKTVKQASIRKRISGGNVSRDGLRQDFFTCKLQTLDING